MKTIKLKYHIEALNLIGHVPSISEQALTELNELKNIIDFIPESMYEFYSLKNSIELISYQDCLFSIPRIIRNIDRFLKNDMLIFMTENQSVVDWAIRLDGSDDPEVLVGDKNKIEEKDKWIVYIDSFTNFIFTQIFDWKYIFGTPYVLQAGYKPSTDDLTFLMQEFNSGPRTYGWPGDINYRFYNELGGIIIHGNWWWLGASNGVKLKKLTKLVWNCGGLKDELWGNTEQSIAILEEIK